MLVVIVGPTGSGKTDLAIELARRFDAEIVSADSQQVYRGMDIGTGKATLEQRDAVPHHLLDVVDPDQEMTAANFVKLADAAIADIQARGRGVVVAGGTMLYVRALLRGLFEGPAADPELRAELKQKAADEGVVALWDEPKAVDAASAERIDPTDERRLIRALEVFRLSGVPLSVHHERHQQEPPRYEARIIGLQPPREELYKRIDARVIEMFDQGLVAEVEALRAAGYGAELRSQQAIGYREVHQMLDEELDLELTLGLVQRNSRRYARRQLSWYRGDPAVEWSDNASMVDLEDLGRYLHPSKCPQE
jgi:tRNA dimethylallyltransferase